MTTKSDDQIQKDKEAVAKMRSAKTAMEGAIRRIERLECALNSVQDKVDSIRKAYSEDLYLNVYVPKNSRYEPVRVRDLFKDIDDCIKSVV